MATYFELKTARRYFHFVAFRFDVRHTMANIWKDCGVQASKDSIKSVETSSFKIERQSVESSVAYYGGGSDYSVNGNRQAPYRYDLIAIELRELNIFIIGFPFKQLAQEIIKRLVEEKRYLKKAGFVKLNLDHLLQESTAKEFSDENYDIHFFSMGLGLSGDVDMTSIEFGGDRPLNSPIYRKLFKEVIQKNQATMKACGLKCELSAADDKGIPKTRGKLHLDVFGNMKIYVHGSGKNMFIFPFIFVLLRKYKCIETTLINPLLHSEDE